MALPLGGADKFLKAAVASRQGAWPQAEGLFAGLRGAAGGKGPVRVGGLDVQ